MGVWSLDWSEDLSVGIPEIDQEHQNFVTMINKLNQAVIDRMDLEEIQDRLQLMLDYAEQNFLHENALLREMGYPGAADHEQEHREIGKKIGEIMGALDDRATLYEWVESGLKVKDSLIDHFLGEDMKFRDYYRSISH